MIQPDPQSNPDSPGTLRRGFQFRLRQTFVVMTGVALGCGLVAWMGSACLLLLFVACGPAATFLILNRTDGECRAQAIILGASLQALLIGGVLFVFEVLPAILANATTSELIDLLVAPINFGLAGGLLSAFLSLPVASLWHLLRKSRPPTPHTEGTRSPEPPDLAP